MKYLTFLCLLCASCNAPDVTPPTFSQEEVEQQEKQQVQQEFNRFVFLTKKAQERLKIYKKARLPEVEGEVMRILTTYGLSKEQAEVVAWFSWSPSGCMDLAYRFFKKCHQKGLFQNEDFPKKGAIFYFLLEEYYQKEILPYLPQKLQKDEKGEEPNTPPPQPEEEKDQEPNPPPPQEEDDNHPQPHQNPLELPQDEGAHGASPADAHPGERAKPASNILGKLINYLLGAR